LLGGVYNVAESVDPAVAEPGERINEDKTAEEGSRVDSPTINQSTEPNLRDVDNAESNTVANANGPAAQQNSSPANDPVAAIRDCIANAESHIIQLFEKKLAFDQFKEQQIERLHGELQDYKRGLAESILLPLVKQIVRYADQIPRHVAALRKKPVEQLGPERLFLELEGVRKDLELILENVGVTMFHSQAMEFDAKVQQVRSTEPIGNAAKHGQIVERLLPGYEMNGRVIEKERVKVFVYQEGGPLTSEQAAEGRTK